MNAAAWAGIVAALVAFVALLVALLAVPEAHDWIFRRVGLGRYVEGAYIDPRLVAEKDVTFGAADFDHWGFKLILTNAGHAPAKDVSVVSAYQAKSGFRPFPISVHASPHDSLDVGLGAPVSIDVGNVAFSQDDIKGSRQKSLTLPTIVVLFKYTDKSEEERAGAISCEFSLWNGNVRQGTCLMKSGAWVESNLKKTPLEISADEATWPPPQIDTSK